MAINTCMFSGNLAADARKAGTAENPIVNFRLIVNNQKKQGGEWVDAPIGLNCVMFGNRAKALAERLTKGANVSVIGRLVSDNYEKDGQMYYGFQLTVTDINIQAKMPVDNKEKTW